MVQLWVVQHRDRVFGWFSVAAIRGGLHWELKATAIASDVSIHDNSAVTLCLGAAALIVSGYLGYPHPGFWDRRRPHAPSLLGTDECAAGS